MSGVRPCTAAELMATAASRLLPPDGTVFAGIGTGPKSFEYSVAIPVVAAELAREFLAAEVALQIGPSWDIDVASAPPDIRSAPFVAWRASALYTASWGLDDFARGGIDVAFVSCAQIDRFGNLNTVCIGPVEKPTVRLVGCVALTDHLASSRRVIVLCHHNTRTFVPAVDFVSGRGSRVVKVITDLAVLQPRPEMGTFAVESVHPESSRAQVEANTGFALLWQPEVARTPEPSEEEIRYIRRTLDPKGIWLPNPR